MNLSLPWRTGRHVGRTVYAQGGGEASREDVLIGVMDTPELAAEACEAHNRRLADKDEIIGYEVDGKLYHHAEVLIVRADRS